MATRVQCGPEANAVGDASTFASFGILSIATLIFTRFAVPETRGRDLESISLRDT